MGKKFAFKTLFSLALQGKAFFRFIRSYSKNEEKHQKIFYSLTRSKTNFPIFEFYFWRLFFEVIAMYLQILRKYCSFLRLHRYMQWFFGNENFAARVAKFDDILTIGLIKIYPAV